MKNFNAKLLIVTLFILSLISILNSCKKANNIAEPVDYKAKAIEATKIRYGSITAPVIFQPSMAASSILYRNKSGQLSEVAGKQNRINARCGQYTCSTAPTASDLYVTATLQYVKWFYQCDTGHDLTAIWDISVPYSLLLQDPNNSNNFSYGNMQIKDGNTVLVTSSNLGEDNLEITNTGNDPNCSSNTLYRVTYTWQDVSETYFPGNSIYCSFTIYNNCPITGNNTSVSYTIGVPYTNTMDVYTIPCDRTDQAFINPDNGPNNEATILGAYNICTPPTGFTGTSDHQIENRLRNNSSSNLWDDQSSTVYWGSTGATATPTAATMNSYTGILYLHYMTSGSGTWLVRYRNRHTGCTPTINGTNDSWDNQSGNNNYITEVWPL